MFRPAEWKIAENAAATDAADNWWHEMAGAQALEYGEKETNL